MITHYWDDTDRACSSAPQTDGQLTQKNWTTRKNGLQMIASAKGSLLHTTSEKAILSCTARTAVCWCLGLEENFIGGIGLIGVSMRLCRQLTWMRSFLLWRKRGKKLSVRSHVLANRASKDTGGMYWCSHRSPTRSLPWGSSDDEDPTLTPHHNIYRQLNPSWSPMNRRGSKFLLGKHLHDGVPTLWSSIIDTALLA